MTAVGDPELYAWLEFAEVGDRLAYKVTSGRNPRHVQQNLRGAAKRRGLKVRAEVSGLTVHVTRIG